MKAKLAQLKDLIRYYADMASKENNAILKKKYKAEYYKLKEQAFEIYLNCAQ